MSYERADTYSAHVLPGDQPEDNSFNEVTKAFRNFILEFRLNNLFIYRDQLRENLLIKNYYLRVNSEHLIGFNEELNKKLSDLPLDMVPLFENAITDIAKRIAYLSNEDIPRDFPGCQLVLYSNSSPISIRHLDSDHISKIVRVSGIIISASVLLSRATQVLLLCRNCKHTMKLKVPTGFGPLSLPPRCLANHNHDESHLQQKCPPDPYVVVHDKSSFIDQQTLKLQEAPDAVPVGEMPRHILVHVDRYLTNQVVPGTRVTLVGTYLIYQSKQRTTTAVNTVAIRNPYLKVLGIQTDVDTAAQGLAFSDEEEEEFLRLSRMPNLYETFSKSIAPSIYGNDDIKKAITCLLMSGSKKILPDGMRLRGDINVLLLGDPGTAKSQLLKFVEKISPISVYTSGKGSSAAGLTASVQRDTQTRDFYLEGGAMVLADGGVVCIDEFDKMRDEDRVAIHEAMEQQTISIAKAGITTVLNSRTSVLAAANPIFGRYDDLKSPGENIDFQTTILSRFDMIFIVKDDHDAARDRSIAQHVMNVHTGNTANNEEQEGEIPIETMKRYIQYAKARCAPRLTAEASEKLLSHFVAIRRRLQVNESDMNERSSIPITVRQLEAIIRITELLAKLTLSPVATMDHVDEAIRLFTASTMNAVDQGVQSGNMATGKFAEHIKAVEIELRRRLPIGWSTAYRTLRRELVDNGKIPVEALDKALHIMERHDVIKFRHQRQNILRVGV
ncbi:MCM-domain-containing protein [Metschnikowia bicuspidata var. bicuspidata NRRL YB-4993]|uniref:DNA replication licensing factor MCM5 n=1 Tax=Metschnikowia bicuspidata var. bicuspidata NRRL YB-4993 TaxID=869754 RepID=A0A1A0HJ01_9ASCO|nr:MCM-domain-containing protein [Metschnikowia bicuspidata var. bicuspidata NRRL YB-4993]OBA23862.1 MCM-domain-containing protein [Metschnikowia bicuspidata var. bicuspidata NRRL YB-4993]